MTLYAAPICVGCTRFHGYRTPTREQFQRAELVTGTCDAYPEGIPVAIWQGSHDHRKPFAGDHKLQFKAKDADAERYAEIMFEGYDEEIAAAAAAAEE